MSKFELEGGSVTVNWAPKTPGYEAKAGRKRVGSYWPARGGYWCQSPFHEQFTGPFETTALAREEVETRFLNYLQSVSTANRVVFGFKANPAPKKRTA